MKKIIRSAALTLMICMLLCAIAQAYGTIKFVENGVTYTVTDRASVYYSGLNNDTLCIDAACDIKPVIRHYSTADIRKGSHNGAVVATSGRQWTNTQISSAHCETPRISSDLKGFGWWGH